MDGLMDSEKVSQTGVEWQAVDSKGLLFGCIQIFVSLRRARATHKTSRIVSAARKKSPRVPFYKPQARILRENS